MNPAQLLDPTLLEKTELTLGFIPLTDCAPLVIAREHGWFEKYGLQVTLSKETSWANIRDKVALGILDGAQMLAPMPIAMSLGIGPLAKPMLSAFAMDLNGNAITVSNALYQAMQGADPVAMRGRAETALALRKVIDARQHRGHAPLTFATVFPYSPHAYELRYWMAAAGIDPDTEVRLVVVPPAQMVEQLRSGRIDGYCVGEPWNAMAVNAGIGHTLITKYELWNNSPEKVFGVTEEWAVQHPHTHHALIAALSEACRWLDEPQHRIEAAALIARGVYVSAPEHVVRMSMTGTFQYHGGEMPQALPDFNVFHRYAANFPWRSHAEWFITQMLRWGQLTRPVDLRAEAAAVYRPDIYREVAAAMGIAAPAYDDKVEGLHPGGWTLHGANSPLEMGADRFFDGRVFDPSRPLEYLDGFAVHNLQVDREALAALNTHPAGEAPQVLPHN